MEVLKNMLEKGDIGIWKIVMWWVIFNNVVGYFFIDIEKVNWDFYSKILRDVKK